MEILNLFFLVINILVLKKCVDATNFTDNDICYTADGIIAKIINTAEKQSHYIYFYLESFYNVLILSESTKESNAPLATTIKQFYPCLYKNCPERNEIPRIDIRVAVTGYQIGLNQYQM